MFSSMFANEFEERKTMKEGPSFGNNKDTIEFMLAALERSDYVYVLPAAGKFRTALELVTLQKGKFIEDIFLMSDEHVLSIYNMKAEDDLVERLEKFRDYIVDMWQSFNSTVTDLAGPELRSQRFGTTYDEDLLSSLKDILYPVTPLVVFFVRNFHQLMISDLKKFPDEKKELIRRIGSLLFDILETRIMYTYFEQFLVMINKPSKAVTSMPRPKAIPLAQAVRSMAGIFLTNMILDKSLIVTLNSNSDYKDIFTVRFSLFEDLISFSSTYYWVKGQEILVNIYKDVLNTRWYYSS